MTGKLWLLLCLLIVASLLGASRSSADSAMWPSTICFTFRYPERNHPDLLGVQLVRCDGPNCMPARALAVIGTCDGVGCLPAPEQSWLTRGGEGKRDGDTFTFRGVANTVFGMHIGLVAQFSDRVRASGLAGILHRPFGHDDAWTVQVRADDLALKEYKAATAAQTLGHTLWRFAASVGVELLVAGLLLRTWARADRPTLSRLLTLVFLVNLSTVPVVWYSAALLQPFEAEESYSLGMLVLIVAALYTPFLCAYYLVKTPHARQSVLQWGAVPFMVLAVVVGLGWWGGSRLFVTRTSAWQAILGAELFAVALEAVLFYLLSRKALSFRLSALLSMSMNAASFLLGEVLTRLGV